MGKEINVSSDSLHDNLNMKTIMPIPMIKFLVKMFMFNVKLSVITVVSDVSLEVMSPESKKRHRLDH